MWFVRHGNDALPPLPLARVVEDRHDTGRLDDLKVETSDPAKIRQAGGHAALGQSPVLRVVGAVEGGHWIDRGRLLPAWGGRSVLPTGALALVILAGVGRLQERELILSGFAPPGHRLWCGSGHSPVRWVDNQRRSAARMFVSKKYSGVVRAADVFFTPPRM